MVLHLTPSECGELEACLRKRNLPASVAQRMRIVLLLDEGTSYRDIEEKLGAARHTTQDFVAFLEEVVATQPAHGDVDVTLDNFSTHKTNLVEDSLQRHLKVQFHFTPTYSSWLNRVESWFSKLQRDVIDRGIFTSVALWKYSAAKASPPGSDVSGTDPLVRVVPPP